MHLDIPSTSCLGKKHKNMTVWQKTLNQMQNEVVRNGWDKKKKRVIRENINGAKFENFPEMTKEELRDLTMGVYQLKQAKSGTDEHWQN